MSNSPLVDYTKISPNKTSPRNHAIDTITIHCYVGQASVESMGNWFAEKRANASCNYGIGTDGRIALIVDEGDRSWCSSNRENDHRAITIECASDKTDPYAINDKVYKSLIELCTDICKRNNIKELKWKADKSLIGQPDKQNLTVHRWFANKSCPGDYIYSRLGQIAKEVNLKLGITEEVKDEPTVENVTISDSNVEEISKVVYGEAGVIRSYNALLGAAQCIHDMLESGQFGKTVTEVMKHNYSAYGAKNTTDDARKAVYDVFVNGKRRFSDAKVLQFRSFTKYSDGNGNMDKTKCADLLKKYTYLGKDARNNQWGHLYFGTKITGETPKEEAKTDTTTEVKEPFKPFQVKVNISYLNIRTGPGIEYAKTGHMTGVGVFTIVEVKDGPGSNSGWGRLKSGAGWICLDYATPL